MSVPAGSARTSSSGVFRSRSSLLPPNGLTRGPDAASRLPNGAK
jgi:hypothetical protein